MKRLVIALLLALLATAAGPLVVGAETGLSRALLAAVNGSGVSGEAVIAGQPAGGTQIEITVKNPAQGKLYAGLYGGTCAQYATNATFTLTELVGGHSVTTLNEPIGNLLGGKYALVVWRSVADPKSADACGELTALINGGVRPQTGGENPQPQTGPATLPPSGSGGSPFIPALAIVAVALSAGAVLLRRRQKPN